MTSKTPASIQELPYSEYKCAAFLALSYLSQYAPGIPFEVDKLTYVVEVPPIIHTPWGEFKGKSGYRIVYQAGTVYFEYRYHFGQRTIHENPCMMVSITFQMDGKSTLPSYADFLPSHL